VDFAESDTVSDPSLADHACSDEFNRGAAWSLKRLAAWLDAANIVADDEAAQRAVDATKMLIAEQARQAAVNLRSEQSSQGEISIP
jgi:hypothetical protein